MFYVTVVVYNQVDSIIAYSVSSASNGTFLIITNFVEITIYLFTVNYIANILFEIIKIRINPLNQCYLCSYHRKNRNTDNTDFHRFIFFNKIRYNQYF